MTRTCKKILTSVFLALCLVASLFAIVACAGTTENEAISYSVTVQTEEAPASGVTVKIRKGGAMYKSLTTGQDGRISFELAADEYDVELSNLPEGYTVPDDTALKLTVTKPDLVVTLEKAFAYTVTLVDAGGAPYYAENVSVIVCNIDTGNCLSPVALGTNGIATIYTAAGNYHTKIVGLPAEVTYDQDEEGYYTGKNFSATDTEMTITIKPNSTTYTTIDLNKTPMTAAEKAAFASDNATAGYTAAAQEFTAIKISKTVEAGTTAYFSLTPTLSGVYFFYMNDAVDYLAEDGIAGFYSEHNYAAGETYSFMAVNNGRVTALAEFVLALPFSSYVEQTSTSSSIPLTIGRAGSNAIVAFNPATAGKYTLTVLGGTSACVRTSTSQPAEKIAPENLPAESDYTQGASETFLYTANHLASGTTIYYAITAKGNYPVTLNVKLEKTGESVDLTTDAEATGLTEQANPEGLITWIPLADGTAENVRLNNGVYQYEENDVYVMITEPIPSSRFSHASALAYLDRENLRTSYTFTEYTATGSTTTDYRLFLRGFKNYDMTPNNQGGHNYDIPETLEKELCYAAYVNDDGAYLLTAELKSFLEKFYENNAQFLNSGMGQFDNEVRDSAWLFPCFYYDNEGTGGPDLSNDPIVGTYKFISKTEDGQISILGDAKSVWDDEKSTYVSASVTADDYKLVVKGDGTFIIYVLEAEYNPEIDNGQWSKSGDTYTFKIPNGKVDMEWNWSDLVFTVTFNSNAQYIKLVGDDASLFAPGTEWEFGNADEIVGGYQLISFTDYDGIHKVGDLQTAYDEEGNQYPGYITAADYKLAVRGDGSFIIYQLGDGYSINMEGTWTKTGSTYAFVYDAGWMTTNFTVTYKSALRYIKIVGDDGEEDTNEGATEFEFGTIDAIVGVYANSDYKLLVNADGTFTIYQLAQSGDTAYKSGTWTKSAGAYTFSYDSITFTVAYNDAAGTLTLTGNDSNTTTWNFQTDAIVGEYAFLTKTEGGDTIKAGDDGITADSYKLVVNKNGYFVIYEGNKVVMAGSWSKTDAGYTFAIPKYKYDESIGEWGAFVALNFTITLNSETGYIKLVGDDGAEGTNAGATTWEFGDALPGATQD